MKLEDATHGFLDDGLAEDDEPLVEQWLEEEGPVASPELIIPSPRRPTAEQELVQALGACAMVKGTDDNKENAP